jgi:hypothetical protein
MTKSLSAFGLVLASTLLFGCDLYFGNGGGSGGGGTGGGGSTGTTCTDNTQCAAGCYCNTSTGTCTEGGFCSTDADCGPGYHCDTMRSSCEPNPPGCTGDASCPSGQTCQNMTCTATCTCTTDAQAKQAGFGWCDTTRMTCMTGQNPAGTCGGVPDASCTAAEPQCPAGSVPLLYNGCWNGNCQVFASCDTAPECTHINDETDCLGRADCSGVYDGLNCTKPDGTACHSGDTNCTCQSYIFAACAKR